MSHLEERALTHAKDTYSISAIGFPLYHLFGPKGLIFYAAQSLIRSSKKVAQTAKIEVMDDEPTEGSYEWDAEDETDIVRGNNAFAQLHTQARTLLTIKEWRMYTMAVEWMRWRDTLPPLTTLARIARVDTKVVADAWAGVMHKLQTLQPLTIG